MNPMSEQLFVAAREGRADEIEALVAKGANPNEQHPKMGDHGSFFDKVTPLMVAAASPRSNVATLRALLENGADMAARSAGEVTAVWYAAGGGSFYILGSEHVRRLAPDHLFRDWGGGDVDRLKLLLDNGANPNDAAYNGRSAIGEACAIGDPKRLRLLIERGGSIWPVRIKRSFNRPQVIEYLDTVRKLKKVRWDEGYSVPICRAARGGSAECVAMLLEEGFPADYRSSGLKLLEYAASVEVAEVLWNAGARPSRSRYGIDAFDTAVQGGRLELAKFLLSKVEPDKLQNYLNRKLMLCASIVLNTEAVEMLLALGADVNRSEKGLGTPLHYACWCGDSGVESPVIRRVLELLLSAGADVNAVMENGLSPLHQAAYGDWGSVTSVAVLLEHGARVDAVDEEGNTPLMLGASRGEAGCIQLLLSAGADRSIENEMGKTALDLAVKHLDVWQGIVEEKRQTAEEYQREALTEAIESVKLLQS